MKTIKALFAILLFSTAFLGCEADSINEEVGIDYTETYGTGEDSGGNEVEDEERGD